MVRLAYQIVEENGTDGLGLIGVRRRGVPLAERLGKSIGHIEDIQVPVGTLDITFYRDDLSTVGPKPVVHESEIGFSIQDKNIVLVDDVLFTGRTIRAALGRAFFPRPSPPRAALRTDRPRPPRVTDRSRIRRPHRANHDERSDRSKVERDRWHGESSPHGKVVASKLTWGQPPSAVLPGKARLTRARLD